jgi:Phosphate transport regulator (distant homolog of PhoU)
MCGWGSITVWLWVSKERRKEVIRMCIEHISKIVSVTEYAVKVLEAYASSSASEVRSWWNEVFKAEKEADDVKRRLIFELSSEVFHPIDRETILRLVLGSDDIAAYAKAWSRRVVLMLPLQERLPESTTSRLLTMGRKVVEATRLVKESAEKLVEEPRAVLELANKIERLEEEVDELRVSVFSEIIKLCDSSKTSFCILSKELMDSIEDAADKCEDVADILRSLALLAI